MGMAPGRAGGFSGSHGGGPAYGGGSHFGGSRAVAPAYSGGSRFVSPRPSMPMNNGTRFTSPRSSLPLSNGARFAGPRPAASVNNGGRFSTRPGFDRPGFNSPGFNRPGFNRPGFNRPVHGIVFGGRPRYWAGGTFGGIYWPRAFFHPGFVRFVTVLPAFYSTFWFAGVPYYYWDDTYYTWSDPDGGYIATNPPPVADDNSSDSGSAEPESSDSSSVYIYPKNGQSDEQTATDRYECHQWAASQTGFDPTHGADQSAGSSGPADYRRAMMACLDARGYSAR